MDIDLSITRRQQAFIAADATEVLFGGAAGGGKSYGQLIDALLYALKYPGSRQLILRRTYAELEKSLIRVSLGLYPRALYDYSQSSHTGRFRNGSLIDFGYCAAENDVYQYQSAEYDVIRFDELTHFTEFQYIYLISRLRGTSGYPKQIKSSTNPGGVGHMWVKARFIDPAPPDTPFVGSDGVTRVFLPSRIDDNRFLTESDPDYKRRLMALPERDRKALLLGEWDIFEGQFFPEFSRSLHVCTPFAIPPEWRRYRTIDYGLDRLACLWIAVSSTREVYVYRELCESNLMISEASERILAAEDERETIYATLAPPDLWGRSQESGRSRADIFRECGLVFTRSPNDRAAGWSYIKELLRPSPDGSPRMRIFSTCTELIRCLPALQIDRRKPDDCATEPHDITHAPDALRGFAAYYFRPAPEAEDTQKRRRWTDDMWQDYYNASPEERDYIKQRYGEPL